MPWCERSWEAGWGLRRQERQGLPGIPEGWVANRLGRTGPGLGLGTGNAGGTFRYDPGGTLRPVVRGRAAERCLTPDSEKWDPRRDELHTGWERTELPDGWGGRPQRCWGVLWGRKDPSYTTATNSGEELVFPLMASFITQQKDLVTLSQMYIFFYELSPSVYFAVRLGPGLGHWCILWNPLIVGSVTADSPKSCLGLWSFSPLFLTTSTPEMSDSLPTCSLETVSVWRSPGPFYLRIGYLEPGFGCSWGAITSKCSQEMLLEVYYTNSCTRTI